MKFIFFLARYSRMSIALAVAAGIISGVCNTALLAIITSAFTATGSARQALIVGFMAFCILLPAMRFLSEYLLTRLAQDALFKLRMQLSGQILAAPLRKLEELGPHKLLAALTDDIPTITNVLLTVPLLCINAAIIIAGLVYLGWLSWQVLLVVLGFMVLGIITYQLPVAKAVSLFSRARNEGDSLMKHFGALVNGTKELKLHSRRRDAFMYEMLELTASALRRYNITGMTVYNAASSWGQVLVFVVVGLTLFALPSFQAIDTKTMIGYVIVLLYLMTPLQVIMNALPSLGRANVSIKKVQDLGVSLDQSVTELPREKALAVTGQWDKLELVGVTHTYRREGEESDFTLGPIDLTFSPGETVFLVGGNGSGKTTLAKLIIGLYSPESGHLDFCGETVTDENREAYRQNFSVVFSDFYLFESLLGLEKAELDERARRYLLDLQLAHKVKVKDGALSTTDLSQGQRKRLALLTAYLEDRPIYLFDEWAADQDPVFKAIFYYQLLPELKARGKTAIVISHDDHYYHVADRIIKLDYGKIDYDKALTAEERGALKVGLSQSSV